MKKTNFTYQLIITSIIFLLLTCCEKRDEYDYIDKYCGNWNFKVLIYKRMSVISGWKDSVRIFQYTGYIHHINDDIIEIKYDENTSEKINVNVDRDGKYFVEPGILWRTGEFTGDSRMHFFESNPGYDRKMDIYGEKTNNPSGLDLTPIAETISASEITSNEANLNGWFQENCLYSMVYFEIGTSTIYDRSILASIQYIDLSCQIQDIGYKLSGLSPGTLYHYRIKVVNSHGIVYGHDITFTTLLP